MMCDVGLPVLDVWTEHEINYRVGTGVGSLKSAEIAGYSFTCIPIDWIASDVDGRVTVVPPAWAVAADLHGKNKWIELALNLKANGEGDGTVVFVVVDDERPRIEIPALEGLDTTGAFFSALPSVLGCRVEIGDTVFSQYIDRPAGTWCPQHDVWGLEPSDVQVNSRVTESPYNPRSRTVLVWGTTYTLSLILDLVPAADIFATRAADVPHTGWAAMAARTPAVGGGSVLEYLLPWIMRATAQGVPFYESVFEGTGWGIGQGEESMRWTLAHGRPVILYTSRAMIGRGIAMRSAGIRGGSADDNGVPFDEKMRFSWDDSVARHVVLQADTALSDMLEVRVGTNRRYRVEMPLIDVTWPAVNAHTVTGSPRTNVETQRIAR